MKKLVILFPGAGYGLDCPLLYYADLLFETKGYERLHMKYQDMLSRVDISAEDKIELLRKYTWEQVKDVNFAQYQDVVFLSKSVGAIEAGVIAETVDVNVKQIFLTPVDEAVSKIGFYGFGRSFAPLSEKGIQQAPETANDPRLVEADLIICSPYTTALHTAAIFSRKINSENNFEKQL